MRYLEELMHDDKHSNLPRKFFAEFAYSCANEARHLVKHEYLIKILDVTALWLEDKVTSGEVKAMVDRYDTYACEHYALAILSAASATYYKDFIFSTYNSAHELTKGLNPKEQKHAQRFLDKVNSLTKVEKALYGVD